MVSGLCVSWGMCKLKKKQAAKICFQYQRRFELSDCCISRGYEIRDVRSCIGRKVESLTEIYRYNTLKKKKKAIESAHMILSTKDSKYR